MPVLKLGDATLAYDVAGSGAALVFLHGVGSDRRTWRPQIRHFAAAGHRVAALDARGHGGSACAPESISIAAFAADTAALVEELGGGAADICGLSLGGIVALELWAARPELVRSLVLAGTWARHQAAAAGLPQRLAAIDTIPLPVLARQRMPAVLAPDPDPDLLRRSIEVMAGKDVACYRRSNEVLWGADMRAVAAGVRVPALVVVGELDRITPPELSAELAGLIPGARLAVIPSAGHLTNEERPDGFNAAVASFLATVGG